jgi:M6 family metalloprotease-like protein
MDRLSSRDAARRGEPRCVPPDYATTRDLPLVVIAVGFNNIDYNDDFDWGATIFQGSKSLSRYYTDMSGGKFTFTPVRETSAFGVGGNTNAHDAANDGVVHVKVDLPHERWDLDESLDDETYAAYEASMVKAMSAAVIEAGNYVDFASYDDNGDGAITTDEMALGFVLAGWEAAAAGDNYEQGEDYYVWAHAYSIAGAIWESEFNGYDGNDLEVPRPGGVKVSDYITIAEYLYEDVQEPISVLAHELGHYLGLPDLYDTSYGNWTWSSYDVSSLSVMCSGSWGYDPSGETASVPYSFDPWSRVALGWVTPVTAENDHAYNLKGFVGGNAVLLIPTARTNEYYLLENRRLTGWDAGMQLEYDDENGGIVIWHIDDEVYNNYAGSNAVNDSNHRPAVMPR